MLGQRGTPADRPRPTQRVVQTPPPAAPEHTPSDPGAPFPPPRRITTPQLHLRRQTELGAPAQPPNQFSPDPGGGRPRTTRVESELFLNPARERPLPPEDAPVPAPFALPRGPLERPVLEAIPTAATRPYDGEPVSPDLRLPRAGVRENRFLPTSWRAPANYPLTDAGLGYPAHTRPATDRWRETGFMAWRRYPSADPSELPYAQPQPRTWHYYRQSVLKGDLPIRGQDLFLALAAGGEFAAEDRTLTTPAAPTTSPPAETVAYRKSRTQLVATRLSLQIDLFRGETVFKPVDWLVRVRPVFSFNHTPARASAVVSLDRDDDPDRSVSPNGIRSADPAEFVHESRPAHDRGSVSLQEAFFEKHLRDLSANYDFVSVRAGNQSFNSDFRGLIFNDTNLGARVFGNYDNNRWQYNVALFDLREKDPLSDLNTFKRRGQVVAVANLYRQDFLIDGYTVEVSFHASFDEADTHYNIDGIFVRPSPLGSVRPHRVTSYYGGWAGEGHIGPWNLSHAVYLVFGRDDFNGLAGRPVNISAQMAALEASYDRDWIRFKAMALVASGDRAPGDGRATGFESIIDNTGFAGPFSYYARQGVALPNTAIALKSRLGLFPDLRTSKTASQQNFVNPGLVLGGIGLEADITPRLRAVAQANVLRFASTAPLQAIHRGTQSHKLGTDLSLGVQWRPLLTNNIVIVGGYGILLPGQGYRDIFRPTAASPRSLSVSTSDAVSRLLHSATLSAVLTY